MLSATARNNADGMQNRAIVLNCPVLATPIFATGRILAIKTGTRHKKRYAARWLHCKVYNNFAGSPNTIGPGLPPHSCAEGLEALSQERRKTCTVHAGVVREQILLARCRC